MFILRRIISEGVESNTCLGIDYVFVLREKSPKEFKRTTEQWEPDDVKEVYGLVTFDDGAAIMPLYEESQYYIMTSDGKTFSNITKK